MPLLATEPDVLNDDLEQTYRRVLSRALALASAALFIVAIVAASLINNLDISATFSVRAILARVVIVSQVLVTGLCARYVEKLPTAAAAILLFSYATLCGIEFAILISPATVAIAFASAALMYAGTAAWGYARGTDLARPIVPVFMIIGGAVALIALNSFLQTPGLIWSASSILVSVFAFLVSIHAQEIRDFYQDFDDDNAEGWKASTIGALLLLLNLLNLYLMICSIFSRKGEDS